ncbi:MAG TPA: TlpA disulfide reductase family protein [Rhodocyclaceae bacterium]|nr:TlpA disulfide reductase family protein [Rhodocyclaceae bacterium]
MKRLLCLAALLALAAGAAPASDQLAVAAAGRQPAAGKQTISLPGIDGVARRLSDWRGQVIVLNFWAAWCEPCLKEIPDLVSLQEEYGGRGLQVVGVGVDELPKLRNVVRSLEVGYPVLVIDPDAGSRLLGQWGDPRGVIPFTVVIDRDGRVAYRHRGPIARADLVERVAPLLAAGDKQ